MLNLLVALVTFFGFQSYLYAFTPHETYNLDGIRIASSSPLSSASSDQVKLQIDTNHGQAILSFDTAEGRRKLNRFFIDSIEINNCGIRKIKGVNVDDTEIKIVDYRLSVDNYPDLYEWYHSGRYGGMGSWLLGPNCDRDRDMPSQQRIFDGAPIQVTVSQKGFFTRARSMFRADDSKLNRDHVVTELNFIKRPDYSTERNRAIDLAISRGDRMYNYKGRDIYVLAYYRNERQRERLNNEINNFTVRTRKLGLQIDRTLTYMRLEFDDFSELSSTCEDYPRCSNGFIRSIKYDHECGTRRINAGISRASYAWIDDESFSRCQKQYNGNGSRILIRVPHFEDSHTDVYLFETKEVILD